MSNSDQLLPNEDETQDLNKMKKIESKLVKLS